MYAGQTMSAQPQVHVAHHELCGAGMYIPTIAKQIESGPRSFKNLAFVVAFEA